MKIVPAVVSAIACVLVSLSGPVYAQRANENVVLTAEDAFGTTIGNESIGLYSSSEARGFSPKDAGNIRLEGLYFVEQAQLVDGIIRGTTMRVGLTAQSYPFPAPTGVVDMRLRLPDDRTIVSTIAATGSWGEYGLSVEAQAPVIPDQLALAVSAGATHEALSHAGTAADLTASALALWEPSDSVDIIPFWSRFQRIGGEARAQIFSSVIPPRVPRRHFFGQDWTQWDLSRTNFGSIARVDLNADWTIQAGLFRSIMNRSQSYFDEFLDVQSSGIANHVVIANPPHSFGSVSGEIRATRVIPDGMTRRHTLHFALRGHDVRRSFGGADSIDLGSTTLGVRTPFPKPELNFSERSRDHTQRLSGGIAYEGLWRGLGEISLGIRKTFNERQVNIVGLPPAGTESSPWLFNGTLAAYLSEDLVAYTSYTRGLEDSGTAPANATNRGEAAAATISKQVDAGLRYTLTSGLVLLTGVFEVKKPFFDIDSSNRFTEVGFLSHRGVEVSLTGPIAEDLIVVLGTVFLRARLSDIEERQSGVGKVPLGRFPRLARLSVQYGPPSWKGFSMDGQLENRSSRYANRGNTLRLPSSTTIIIGGRYQFTPFGSTATLRFQIRNLTNKFAWDIPSPGSFKPIDARHFEVNLTADF